MKKKTNKEGSTLVPIQLPGKYTYRVKRKWGPYPAIYNTIDVIRFLNKEIKLRPLLKRKNNNR